MNPVHVAVAVIRHNDQILISRRSESVHQGGLWEFPGGKVETGETIIDALRRELDEELGIRINPNQCFPLIDIHHDYGDKKVWLDVWTVDDFSGEPYGREGQPVSWVNPEALTQFSFPQANLPIVTACCLPRYYAITPALDNHAELDTWFTSLLSNDQEKLLLWRNPELLATSKTRYLELAAHLLTLCRQNKLRMMLSGSIDLLDYVEADGIHLPSCYLEEFNQRPVPKTLLLAASCHNSSELKQAKQMGIDFCTLSPVFNTASHPQAAPMGWDLFAKLCHQCSFPVYALGGMAQKDTLSAMKAGAQGIAGISLWQSV